MTPIEKTTETSLTARGIPQHKARVMVKSVARGLALILLGVLFGAAALGTLYFLVVNLKQEPGKMSMLLILGFGAAAIYFIVAGGNVMSGQALDAVAEGPIFGRIARLVRFWKQT